MIANVAQELEPDLIVVENVPAFLTKRVEHPDTRVPISAANLLISLLRESYHVFPLLCDLCEYGVPQTRKRAFLTFVRHDLEVLNSLIEGEFTPYPRPTYTQEHGDQEPTTLREALKAFGLPSLDARSEEAARADVGNGLHAVPVWSDRRYDMVAAIPVDSGASAWNNNVCPNCGTVEVDLEAATCPDCHDPLLRPVVQNKDGTYRLIKGFKTSSYKRMEPDKPAATITTASGHIGSHTTIHPSENRLLSALECALIQTFPDNFNWGEALELWGHTNIRQMIGEAVPPAFTELHGHVLTKLLDNYLPTNLLAHQDKRCKKARKKLELQQLGQHQLI